VDCFEEPFRPYKGLLTELASARGLTANHLRLPIRDMGVPSPATMEKILNTIDAALDRGQPTYVHCWGGYGRTGTVVGCYLARHGIARGPAALAHLACLRQPASDADQPSPQTAGQCAMVEAWR
jgi:protein-tyrosine phosphatase